MVIFLMCITLELMGITICFQRTANLSRPFDQGLRKTVGPRELLAFKRYFVTTSTRPNTSVKVPPMYNCSVKSSNSSLPAPSAINTPFIIRSWKARIIRNHFPYRFFRAISASKSLLLSCLRSCSVSSEFTCFTDVNSVKILLSVRVTC